MKSLIILFSIILIIILGGCGGNGNTNGSGGEQDSLLKADTAQKIKERIVKTQKVFYNIPSPIITAGIFKKSGAAYDKRFLNPYQKVSQYSTTAGKGLNLGVYGADLSFTGIFDQPQTTMYYINTVKTLADELSVSNVFTSDMINRLSNNINNRDSVLKIIADSYRQMDDYFKNNNRKRLAAFVTIGGWIEGLYIGTQMVVDTTHQTKLTNKIAQQKYSVNDLIKLLDTYKSDKLIAHFQNELKDLQHIFNEIKVTQASPVKTKKVGKNTIEISGGNQLKYNMQTIVKIKKKTADIRREIIQTS